MKGNNWWLNLTYCFTINSLSPVTLLHLLLSGILWGQWLDIIIFAVIKTKKQAQEIKWVFHHLANKMQTLSYLNSKSNGFLLTQAVSWVSFALSIQSEGFPVGGGTYMLWFGTQTEERIKEFIPTYVKTRNNS